MGRTRKGLTLVPKEKLVNVIPTLPSPDEDYGDPFTEKSRVFVFYPSTRKAYGGVVTRITESNVWVIVEGNRLHIRKFQARWRVQGHLEKDHDAAELVVEPGETRPPSKVWAQQAEKTVHDLNDMVMNKVPVPSQLRHKVIRGLKRKARTPTPEPVRPEPDDEPQPSTSAGRPPLLVRLSPTYLSYDSQILAAISSTFSVRSPMSSSSQCVLDESELAPVTAAVRRIIPWEINEYMGLDADTNKGVRDVRIRLSADGTHWEEEDVGDLTETVNEIAAKVCETFEKYAGERRISRGGRRK
ncbi:unnamed protein product [Allacma fusca]|uniref:Uncharacterized protein n=1 Tax=Allacma fusca TaxID=39272 RepID=A0A8J2J580_9HEXA|nr:unnamed protein product [Allacma fusca]